FTGLPTKTPLTGFVHPASKEVYVADWLGDARKKHVTDLQAALCTTTSRCEVTSCASKRADAATENPKSSLRVFRSAILCLSDRSSTGRQNLPCIGADPAK
ncbi:hypothetical protein DYB36_008813, partial [Aphanomyces astaci]